MARVVNGLVRSELKRRLGPTRNPGYGAGVSELVLELRRVGDGLFTASKDGVVIARSKVAVSPDVWEVYSTVVRREYEGHGVAARLTAFVLDTAGAAGVSVIPSCWYVDRYIRRNDDRYGHLRVDHESAPVDGSACLIAPLVVGHEEEARLRG